MSQLKTYAVKTADGAVHYIAASRPGVARAKWERTHNEVVVSIKLCRH